MKSPKLFQLQIIKTPDGVLTPIYKDWEGWHEEYSVKMVYHTSIGPGISKGPILHERRSGMMSCISGDITVECMHKDKITKYNLSEGDKKYVLVIPAGTPNKIINNSETDAALILNLPDKAWHPDDEDTIKFKNWDEYKVKYKNSIDEME